MLRIKLRTPSQILGDKKRREAEPSLAQLKYWKSKVGAVPTQAQLKYWQTMIGKPFLAPEIQKAYDVRRTGVPRPEVGPAISKAILSSEPRRAANLARTGVLRPEVGPAISKARITGILAGTQKLPQNNYFKGKKLTLDTIKAGKIYCHSTWEQVYVRFLDSNPEVITFEKEPVRIAYVLENKQRAYIPDFLVTFKEKQVLVEIKPECFLDSLETKAKIAAAETWCHERSITFLIVSDNEINYLQTQETSITI